VTIAPPIDIIGGITRLQVSVSYLTYMVTYPRHCGSPIRRHISNLVRPAVGLSYDLKQKQINKLCGSMGHQSNQPRILNKSDSTPPCLEWHQGYRVTSHRTRRHSRTQLESQVSAGVGGGRSILDLNHYPHAMKAGLKFLFPPPAPVKAV